MCSCLPRCWCLRSCFAATVSERSVVMLSVPIVEFEEGTVVFMATEATWFVVGSLACVGENDGMAAESEIADAPFLREVIEAVQVVLVWAAIFSGNRVVVKTRDMSEFCPCHREKCLSWITAAALVGLFMKDVAAAAAGCVWLLPWGRFQPCQQEQAFKLLSPFVFRLSWPRCLLRCWRYHFALCGLEESVSKERGKMEVKKTHVASGSKSCCPGLVFDPGGGSCLRLKAQSWRRDRSLPLILLGTTSGVPSATECPENQIEAAAAVGTSSSRPRNLEASGKASLVVLSTCCFVFMMIEQSCVLDVEHRTTFHRHVAHQAGPLCALKRNLHDRHSHLNMDIWCFW